MRKKAVIAKGGSLYFYAVRRQSGYNQITETEMLTSYIQAAMRLAKYEILDSGEYYGEIPGFEGVWASASTLEDCREQLRETLEDWIVLGLRLGHNLPVAGNINLIPAGAA